MRTPHDEDFLPELPPMADDGSVGTGEEGNFAFDIETGDAVGLDDRTFDDGDFDEAIEEDETSWLGGEAIVLDLGGDDAITGEAEEGWLDDRPMQNIDVGLDTGEDGAPEGPDAGLEGIEDPGTTRRRGGGGDGGGQDGAGDEDGVDLPPLAPGGADGPENDLDGILEIDMRDPMP